MPLHTSSTEVTWRFRRLSSFSSDAACAIFASASCRMREQQIQAAITKSFICVASILPARYITPIPI